MKISEATYLAIREVLWKWYGLGQERANLQVLIEIEELLEKDQGRPPAPWPMPMRSEGI